MSDTEIHQAVIEYLSARKHLLDLGREYPGRIGGNDNIIGRIGEFVAMRFLESRGQTPSKVPHSSNPGFDLVEGGTKTQVKVITGENQNGRNVRLKPPWNQFLLIELGVAYEPIRIGVLTETGHHKALRENPSWSSTPIVALSMLGEKGRIGRYGNVYVGADVDVLPSLAE